MSLTGLDLDQDKAGVMLPVVRTPELREDLVFKPVLSARRVCSMWIEELLGITLRDIEYRDSSTGQIINISAEMDICKLPDSHGARVDVLV